MALTDAGEDNIVYCEQCTHCANAEISKVVDGEMCPKCGKGKLKKARASEVGNVFDLGDKYPKAFGFTYKDKEGKEQTPIVGCYGFGTSRLVGTIVETFADDKGIVWPEGVAPFSTHLVSLGKDDDEISKTADALYADMTKAGIEVLYDDRDLRAGEKFAESDLLGIPKRIVVGKDAVATGEFEVVNRATGKVDKVSRSELVPSA